MREIEDWMRHDPTGRYAVTRVRMTALEDEAGRHRMTAPGSAPAGERTRTKFGRWLARLGQLVAEEGDPLALREGLAEPVSRRPAR